MPDITYASAGTRFQLSEKGKTTRWLLKIATSEGRTIDLLSYVFASDRIVLGLNKKFLRHNTLTDIITFDYSESKDISGEIYISIPRVRENARLFKQSFETELRRVMAHGLLHLLGYDDKTARATAQMRRKEDGCLSLWS